MTLAECFQFLSTVSTSVTRSVTILLNRHLKPFDFPTSSSPPLTPLRPLIMGTVASTLVNDAFDSPLPLVTSPSTPAPNHQPIVHHDSSQFSTAYTPNSSTSHPDPNAIPPPITTGQTIIVPATPSQPQHMIDLNSLSSNALQQIEMIIANDKLNALTHEGISTIFGLTGDFLTFFFQVAEPVDHDPLSNTLTMATMKRKAPEEVETGTKRHKNGAQRNFIPQGPPMSIESFPEASRDGVKRGLAQTISQFPVNYSS